MQLSSVSLYHYSQWLRFALYNLFINTRENIFHYILITDTRNSSLASVQESQSRRSKVITMASWLGACELCFQRIQWTYPLQWNVQRLQGVSQSEHKMSSSTTKPCRKDEWFSGYWDKKTVLPIDSGFSSYTVQRAKYYTPVFSANLSGVCRTNRPKYDYGM